MDWTRQLFEERLRAHQPKSPGQWIPKKRAAVAAVIDFHVPDARVLLMQRTTRASDRWSGHVSFPGGHAEPQDPDLLATAVRETHEEVGLDLRESATLLGQLDGIQAVAHGRILPLTITPFVFALEKSSPLTLSEEAEAVFWLPLKAAAEGELDATYDWKAGPLSMPLPAWVWQDRTVWGLTYQMLMSLVNLVRT